MLWSLLTHVVDIVMPESPSGFRRGRSTIDMIFVARLLQKKCRDRDMIETYKILTGKYDIETAPSLVGVCSSVTRGHSLRLQKIGQNMIYVSFVLLIE